MCEKCRGFFEPFKINTPSEYLDLVRQLVEICDQGTFQLVRGDCALDELLKSSTWPGDTLSHDFACTSCGSLFHLVVDTYHGGGNWRAASSGQKESVY